MNKAKLAPLLRQAKADGWSKWIRSEADERAVLAGCRFDQKKVDRVARFFKKFIRHGVGRWAGDPFVLMDWQLEHVIGPIFGWLRADGFRRIRRAYIEVPKKNGKSALASALGVYMLIGDGEPGAQVYSAATKRDQAGIVHKEAIRMVKASTPLRTRLNVNESTFVIYDKQTDSRYASLSADAAGSEGLNSHCMIKDELHVWINRPFFDSLAFAGVARDQPLDFTITTAGIYDQESIGWKEHEYAERFINGDFADNSDFHGFIAAAKPEDDITDPKIQAKANPSYGHIIKAEEIAKAVKDAEDRPALLNRTLRYRFNLWTAQLEEWIPMDAWRECGGAIDEAELEGRLCCGGLDLATKRDLTAFALMFPPILDDEPWKLLVRSFAPQDTAAERERRDNVPYLQWAREGWLTLTPGKTISYQAIRRQIVEDSERFRIETVAADQWGLEFFEQQIQADGVEIVTFAQNLHNYSEPCKQFEAIIADGSLQHGDNPLLTWAVGNMAIYDDGNGNIRPSKKSSIDRIDPGVASIMAFAMCLVHDESDVPSIMIL